MFSQSVGYAVVALGIIANARGKPILVKNIAASGHIPTPFLAKLIHILGRKGVVETQRGIGGGVNLKKQPEEISLFDLCTIFDDPVLDERCMLGNTECSDEKACPCHKFWIAHRQKEMDFLKTTTIAQIAKAVIRDIAQTSKRPTKSTGTK